jgi:hypothetical protein
MPTIKPRITITLTDHAHAVLSKLAKAQNVSMSSIVVDLVDTTLPVLERLCAVLENAAHAPQAVLDDLLRTMASAQSDFEEHKNAVMGDLDSMVDLAGGVSGAALAAPETVPAGPRPPTSNRGVRISPPTSNIEQISPMKKGERNGRAEK